MPTGKIPESATNPKSSHSITTTKVAEIPQRLARNKKISEDEPLNKIQLKVLNDSETILENAQHRMANDEKFRIRAMEEASKTMGKYLQHKENLTQPWILHHITSLIHGTEPTPSMHQFKFSNDRKAAKFNTKLIKYTDYDLEKCIVKQKHSILTPGSEFRQLQKIRKLLQYHEDWKDIKAIIEHGCDYKLQPDPDEKTRLSDLKAMLNRGNHQSAKKNIDVLQKAFDKEVSRGWLLPVTVESLPKIKGLSIIPLGIADQFSINDRGERIFKQRVTHDASFPAPSGISVNNQVIEALLQD